ncbi:hypothetical protein BpHYR1_011786 [Brachionus plicatilis]|uniref:Uncharacterized protein n=1 Tax=Brachionus plicatilis TaxID=10195 RepID=A0A3M7RU48_BRAPC|nr:hypothetical protein BpHYR1_011786 [Brachionus plicatilis]
MWMKCQKPQNINQNKNNLNVLNVSNDQDSIAFLLSSAKILKTPVLEDHLNTLQIPVQPNVQTSIQNIGKSLLSMFKPVTKSKDNLKQNKKKTTQKSSKKSQLLSQKRLPCIKYGGGVAILVKEKIKMELFWKR